MYTQKLNEIFWYDRWDCGAVEDMDYGLTCDMVSWGFKDEKMRQN